ncbi:hypothetical protein ACEQ8H_002095 [Pleosporales sp. CAS-2024a]
MARMINRKTNLQSRGTIPEPKVLSPSGTFDGIDGKWSTFLINVAGDGQGQGQSFKVLISTSSPMTVVPGQTDWCSTEDCAKSRGVMNVGALGLDITQTPWYNPAGTYELPFSKAYGWSQSLLSPEFTGNLTGYWGTTTVGLGPASNESITIENQYVANSYSQDFFLGSLGLSALPISAEGATEQSFLSGLASANFAIPSASYGFTAGAAYKNGGKGVPGNMVFGGFDQSRLVNQQAVSISMPNKTDKTLIVGVNSITYTPNQAVQQGASSLTKTSGVGFLAVIDSTLPYLVLPDDICDEFVVKFGLGFDNTTGLYTINSTSHEQNQQQNATVEFRISPSPQNNSNSTTIVLPYEALCLQASAPIYSNTTNYFPIRKSSNNIYILGRTFLQEAYLVVDYERATFKLAPAVFSDPMPHENLVAIAHPSDLVAIAPPSAKESSSNSLSAGAIAGIVIGIVAVFLLLGGGAFLHVKKRRRSKANTEEQEGKPSGIETFVAGGGMVKHRRISELSGSQGLGSPQQVVGYYGGDHKSIPELSPDSPPVELSSPPLDGSNEQDYFAAGMKPRRRGATRDSSGQATPRTPVAELPGDEGANGMHRPKHVRGPSDNSLSTNIDEVLAGQDKGSEQVQRKHSSRFVEHTGEGDEPTRADEIVSPLENTRCDEGEADAEQAPERRPSHTRGLSDTTIQSDTTAVSQPTPEELDRWARYGKKGSRRL